MADGVPVFSELPKLLNEAAAAKNLCVSLSTMRRWRREGTGPAFFRLDATIRYTPEALEQFIAQHTASAVSA
jgi:hypothetical protein